MPFSFYRTAAHVCAALLLAAASLQAGAQTEAPGRVGRISQMEGAVNFAPAESGDWGPAEYNRPLTAGDRLQTAPGARAELHSGSTALRLSSQTALEINELDDNTSRLTLSQGSLHLRVRNLYPGERLEIDTPNLAFTVNQPGEYRLDVDTNYGTTGVTVRSGGGVAYGENGAARNLGPQQQLRFADRQLAQEVAVHNPTRDGFDLWAASLDQAEDRSLSARYVSRDTIGYQQLDAHGDWRTDSEYGAVWFPRVTVGQWAPYRNGQWRWVPPWGWTWVDNAPWGFAPFHYGRWAQIGDRWAWVPGPIAPRPVYAPALVRPPVDRPDAWLDHRHPPSPGWRPLAPGEAWRPGIRPRPQDNDGPRGPDRNRPFPPPGAGGQPLQVPPMVQPAVPGNMQLRPGIRPQDVPSAEPLPRPEMRPGFHPFENAQPTPAARSQAEQEQRAQQQRQQQIDRERQQQEQNRNMNMVNAEQQRQRQEQFQREQDQRSQIQRLQQDRQRQEQQQQQQQQSQREQRPAPPGAPQDNPLDLRPKPRPFLVVPGQQRQ